MKLLGILSASIVLAGCASMTALMPDQTERSVKKTKDAVCKHYCGRFTEEVRLEFREAYEGAIIVNCSLLCETE